MTALTAWQTYGTYTTGCRFQSNGELTIIGSMNNQPFHGSYPHATTVEPMHTNWIRRDLQNELKRGWRPLSDPPTGITTEPDAVIIQRRQPGARGASLILVHQGVDFQRPSIEGVQLEYFRQDRDGTLTPLPEAAWADWDHHGRLLLANRDGTIAIHERRKETWTPTWSEDLNPLEPAPGPAPDWAKTW
ncbi:hypothetical protein [Acrocarpospora catenulata]|uniref:hypothetical protein n=1 Tax=Acrocarpospora catenulata TaxID=2836182 RepID=UPI001BDA66DA|nr:hypothetical protein [Acrocarpospora catenulata]